MLHEPTGDDDFRSFLPGNQQEDDKNLIIQFFVDKKLMGAKSEAAGRPIYEDREYVRVMIKGQDKQIVVHEVTAQIRQKYPISYQRFLQQKPAPVIGTPIDMLPGVGPSLAHHLKGLNLRSIEDVANVTDENTLQAMGAGARDLVKRSRAWMEQSSERALNLEEANKQLAADNEDLKAKIAAFDERMAALEKKPQAAPGKKAAKKKPAKAAKRRPADQSDVPASQRV